MEIKNSSKLINEVSLLAEQIVERTNQVSRSIISTNEGSINGIRVVINVKCQMNTIQNKVARLEQAILGLNKRSSQIGNISDLIFSIAKQMKLLSLNTCIEATRAGDAGKGFV